MLSFSFCSCLILTATAPSKQQRCTFSDFDFILLPEAKSDTEGRPDPAGARYRHRREAINPLPSRLDIDDEFVLNLMLDLSFVPLFAVENFDIPFDPKCNAPSKVPNFDHFTNFTMFLRILLSEQNLLPVQAIIVTSSNRTQFMCVSSPRPYGLNAIPKFVSDRFARVREAKNTFNLGVQTR